MAVDTRVLVGSGWDFPLRVTGRGGIALVTADDKIDAAVRMILETAPGERVLRPDFGCRVWDYLFDPIEPTTLSLMREAVVDAIEMWEPRIDLDRVTCRAHFNRVDIDIAYTIRATGSDRSLVYPFYVIPTEEEPV